MIQLILKHSDQTPNTRGYELLMSVLELNGIEYTTTPDLRCEATAVLTDYFVHEGETLTEAGVRATEIAKSAESRKIPIIWYYPGECCYTEAVVYNPTGRLAKTLSVPTYLIKSGDNLLPDMQGYTQVFTLERYHIFQVLNRFNQVRLMHTRRSMETQPKSKKFLYLNGVARHHREMLYTSIRDRGLLNQAIWSWRDLKQGLGAAGADPVVNWRDDLLMLNQFRYQCFYPDHYIRTEFSLVVETAQGEHFVSEKTAKCLVLGHPFVLLGNQNFLPKLREWGYKTFDHVVDHDYDRLHVYDGKVLAITNEVERLCNTPDVFADTQEDTMHNLQRSMVLAAGVYRDLLDMFVDILGGHIINQNLPNISVDQAARFMSSE